MTLKIINNTSQSIQTLYGILKPRGFLFVKEKDEQIKSLEEKRLITIKVVGA